MSRFEKFENEFDLTTRLEQLRTDGVNDPSITVISKESLQDESLKYTDVNFKNAEGTAWDKFISIFSDNDPVDKVFSDIDMSDAEQEDLKNALENGDILLLVDSFGMQDEGVTEDVQETYGYSGHVSDAPEHNQTASSDTTHVATTGAVHEQNDSFEETNPAEHDLHRDEEASDIEIERSTEETSPDGSESGIMSDTEETLQEDEQSRETEVYDYRAGEESVPLHSEQEDDQRDDITLDQDHDPETDIERSTEEISVDESEGGILTYDDEESSEADVYDYREDDEGETPHIDRGDEGQEIEDDNEVTLKDTESEKRDGHPSDEYGYKSRDRDEPVVENHYDYKEDDDDRNN